MLYAELEGSTLDQLIAAFGGRCPDGEEFRASFYDDVAGEIARRGGIEFLTGQLDQSDNDRLAAAIGALAFCDDPAVDRKLLNRRLRELLNHPAPELVATALDGLWKLEDRTVHDRVVGMVDHGTTGLVRARALVYLAILFPDEALPLLLRALHDPDARVRFWAVDTLDDLEQFNDRATFETMLGDPDEDVREHARYIVGHHFSD